jgi:hypothetical protein
MEYQTFVVTTVRYIYVPADSRNIAKNGKSDDKLEPSESSENI